MEVAHQGNQAQALEEVDAVVAIARSLLQPGTTWTNADGQTLSVPKTISEFIER